MRGLSERACQRDLRVFPALVCDWHVFELCIGAVLRAAEPILWGVVCFGLGLGLLLPHNLAAYSTAQHSTAERAERVWAVT
jgi:hypothetical protein